MHDHADQTLAEIHRTSILRIYDGRGKIVTCVKGHLWVTRDGCPRDFQIERGASYLIESADTVLVSAFEPSVARVRRPTAHAPASRPRSAQQRCTSMVRRRALAVSAHVAYGASAALSPVLALHRTLSAALCRLADQRLPKRVSALLATAENANLCHAVPNMLLGLPKPDTETRSSMAGPAGQCDTIGMTR